MKVRLFILLSLSFVAHAQAQMTQAEAFAAGQSTGSRAAVQGVFNNINASTGAAKVDGYSSAPAEKSYWGVNSPIAPVLSAGAGKITSCSGTKSNDPRIANQCEAINALNEQPSKRPPGLITATDPLIVAGDAITANPETIAGSITGAYSACTTNEVSLGKEKVEETCDEYSSTETQKCTIGAKITVDPDHLYKCKDSQRVEANSSCTIGRVIQVDADANYQCTTTEKVHQNLTCNRTYAVTASRSYKGMPPDATYFSMVAPAHSITSHSFSFIYYWHSSNSGIIRTSSPYTMPAGGKVYIGGSYVGSTGSGGALNFAQEAHSGICYSWISPKNRGPCDFVANMWNSLAIGSLAYERTILAGTLVEIKVVGNCPANFTRQADNSCLSNDYQTKAANPACSLIGSPAASYSGLNSVTEYQFACKTMNDQCTGLAARAK